MNTRTIRTFQKTVREHYRRHGRKLPWRRTTNPYRILVSEIMLQQTRVDRVIPKYRLFLTRFPTLRSLAVASLADVLRVWQGLGYNRRAKFLHETVRIVVREHMGIFPKAASAIEQLPGIGHYTARAIMTFAYNVPDVFIETNIRTVYLHSFFAHGDCVPDRHILPYIADTLDRKNPREWYAALMDYGAWLKQAYGNANRRSAHYTTQSAFIGSNRQLRGLILKTVLFERKISMLALAKKIQKPIAGVRRAADALVAEGLLTRSGTAYLCEMQCRA